MKEATLMLRARRRKPRPQIELLEPRITPSNIGVALGANGGYGNGSDYIWVDVHNAFWGWEPLGTPGTVPVNSDEYPLESAQSSALLTGYPDGDYQLSYTGTGTVSFSGIGTLAGPITTDSNGVHTGTVIINQDSHSNNNLVLTVTGVSPTATISNFHLYAPGYGSDPTQMFTNTFLKTLEPFSAIRFVDWESVINSDVSSWSQRVPPTSFIATQGVPFEDMIELANESQKDMWLNIPALATPAFVENLAQLVYANLDPNLNVYLEYSDETWNDSFAEYSQVLQAATTNPLVTAKDATTMIQQESAYEIVSIGQTFKQVFGASSARIRPVAASFVLQPSTAQAQLQFIASNYGPPDQYISGIAVTAYVGLPSGDDVAGLTLNGLFADLNQSLNTTFIPRVKANASVAADFNVPLFAYEGNISLSTENGINVQVKDEAENDPRMFQAMVALLNDWNTYAGPNSLFMDLQLNSWATDPLNLQTLPWVTAAGSERYDAMVSMLLTAGDANRDGTVNFADFQVLEQYYGLSNTYWSQGDFNGEGVTNWSDLNLLRTNIDPTGMTPGQFLEMALFGQPSALIAGQISEYDGYGVAYVSAMPWVSSSNGQGPVRVNSDSTGAPISLGGLTYPQGLGVYANSNVVVNLGGQYSVFQSEIGVPASFGSSSVIFQVYGDGTLLYQSSAITSASGAVPISVPVSGVQQLSLQVIGSTSSTTGDSAVWADARLISTANFLAHQVSPYTLTWQVSENGQVLSTATTDSFVFAYATPGVYTIALTVEDGNGNTASSSETVTVNSPAASAALVKQDNTTEGNWIGTYGSQSHNVVGSSAAYSGGTTVTAEGESTITWAATTADTRALQNPGGAGRVAAAWSSPTSFTVDVDFTDGAAHILALYALDWDGQGRSEQIQIANAATGAVLASQTISNFSTGTYLDWNVSGNVLITFTRLAGPGAVLSGLFIDPPATAAALVNEDSMTQGNWIGTYGTQGYYIPGLATSLPAYATVTSSVPDYTIWDLNSNVTGSLEDPNGTDRILSAWSSSENIVLNVNLADEEPHDLALYLFDWRDRLTKELVQIANALTGQIIRSQYVSVFSEGVYLQWVVTGDVTITIVPLQAEDGQAVVSAIFIDPPSALPPQPPPASATLVKLDTKTEGNWIGAYGSDGYDFAGGAESLPSYAAVNIVGATIPFSAASNNPAAPENPSGTGRTASEWGAQTALGVEITITDGLAHDIGVYALDGYSLNTYEQIQVTDAKTGAVLDTETVGNFAEGAYFQWAVTGSVVITVTRMNVTSAEFAGFPDVAVLSGIFFDPATSAAAYITKDTTTQGNWIGPYGSQGYNVVGGASSYPAYAVVQTSGASTTTWASPTNDPRGLQKPGGGGSRVAAAWSSATTMTISIGLTDDQAHDITLYAVDWDSQGRSEKIQLTNSATGAVLDTETLSSFSGGAYLQWRVFGSVTITVTDLSGPSAVVSGLFFDPPSISSSQVTPATASIVKLDSTTEGSWEGVYGSKGYDIADSVISVPSGYIEVVGATIDTWAATTADPRAPLIESGTSRNASAWTSPTSLSVLVDLPSGQTNDLALYALDWDSQSRSEQIQISSVANGVILDTRTISNFTNGVYLQWVITGSVVVTVTRTGGPNAVLSGVFLDPATASANDHLSVAGIPTATPAGTVENVTVTALSPNGATDPSYLGTVNFTSTDSQAVLPTNYTFTAADNGTHTFTVTLKTAGTQSIIATDTVTASITGSESNISVQPAAASILKITGFANPATAGTASNLIVTAYDPYGNIATSYTGTIHFSSSDSQAALPGNYTFTTNDAGVHTFSATLKTVGTRSITATDTVTASITGSESNIGVQPAAASVLTVTGLANPVTAGVASNLTVTAYDPYGNVARGYTGTIHFSSSDGQAVLPVNYTFTTNDAGVHIFSATLKTVGTRSITATDTVTASITGSESNISVQPAAASVLTVTGLANPMTAGVASSLTVTAYDPYGNVATGYTGTIHFSSSDGQAVLPGNYTFTVSDAGTHLFAVTFNTTGQQSLISTDTATATITGSASVTVNAAASNGGSAVFVKEDSTTLGSWIGVYGQDGYSIAGNATSYPSYATVSVTGSANFVWAASTSATKALQNASGTGRLAACWYAGTSFAIHANFTDGQVHDFAVYAIDWSTSSRSEQIQITSAATGSVLDTETISNFNGGDYLQWKVSGNVVITVTKLAGINAVLSGVFLDPATAPGLPSSATASLIGRDTTTEGNWIGVYGLQGYNIIGNATSYPSYATVTPSGQSTWTWAASTNDRRALQTAGGSSRTATAWYGNAFSISVNLTDGQLHTLTLYALDWSTTSRSEQIQITSAATGAILDTETVSSFHSGVYLRWEVSGNLVIEVTRLAGLNAVVSGIFFDAPPAGNMLSASVLNTGSAVSAASGTAATDVAALTDAALSSGNLFDDVLPTAPGTSNTVSVPRPALVSQPLDRGYGTLPPKGRRSTRVLGKRVLNPSGLGNV